MFESLIKSIEDTFVQFSLRRLFYILFLVAVSVGGAYLFDTTTGYTHYRRLDSDISALERLATLEEKGVAQSSTLGPTYQRIVTRLNTESTSGFAYRFDPEPATKFLSAALIPVLFMLYGFLQVIRRQPEAGSLFLGAFIATLVLGVPAAMVPTWHSLKLTAGLLATAQLLFMLTLNRYYGSRLSPAK